MHAKKCNLFLWSTSKSSSTVVFCIEGRGVALNSKLYYIVGSFYLSEKYDTWVRLVLVPALWIYDTGILFKLVMFIKTCTRYLLCNLAIDFCVYLLKKKANRDNDTCQKYYMVVRGYKYHNNKEWKSVY